jgi:hypothetical protein
LYDQIIKKKDDLFIIFLAILPSLSPLVLDNIKYDNSIYFFLFIDPIFIASLFTLYRNFLTINFRKINYNFFLYIIIFIYALINLIILYLSGQNDNQGLTYAFKAVVYISAIFTVYTNNFINFKNQVLKIIIVSIIIIYIREVVNLSDAKISGHLIFFITAFIPFIIFYKFKLLHLLIYLPSLLLISYQTTTIGSRLNSITSLLIKTNSLLNSKSPDHQSIYLSTTKEEMICLETASNPTTKGVSHSSLLKASLIKGLSPPTLCLNLPNTLQTIRISPL